MKKEAPTSAAIAHSAIISNMQKQHMKLTLPIPKEDHFLLVGIELYQVRKACHVDSAIRALIQTRKKESRLLTEEIYLSLKDFFQSEPQGFSHLYFGISVFAVYYKQRLRYKYLERGKSMEIEEAKVKQPFLADDKTYFWLMNSVTLQKKEELQGKTFAASSAMGIAL